MSHGEIDCWNIDTPHSRIYSARSLRSAHLVRESWWHGRRATRACELRRSACLLPQANSCAGWIADHAERTEPQKGLAVDLDLPAERPCLRGRCPNVRHADVRQPARRAASRARDAANRRTIHADEGVALRRHRHVAVHPAEESAVERPGLLHRMTAAASRRVTTSAPDRFPSVRAFWPSVHPPPGLVRREYGRVAHGPLGSRFSRQPKGAYRRRRPRPHAGCARRHGRPVPVAAPVPTLRRKTSTSTRLVGRGRSSGRSCSHPVCGSLRRPDCATRSSADPPVAGRYPKSSS
jgi:hypothetical protein